LRTSDSEQGFPETERQAAWAALRQIREAVEELFGPAADLQSFEVTGPDYADEAVAIVEALQRVAAKCRD
jgi:hypothetical protein